MLYRVNAQSRALEDGLIRDGIPYRVINGARFYDRPEVKLATAVLRLVADSRTTALRDTFWSKFGAWARSAWTSSARRQPWPESRSGNPPPWKPWVPDCREMYGRGSGI